MIEDFQFCWLPGIGPSTESLSNFREKLRTRRLISPVYEDDDDPEKRVYESFIAQPTDEAPVDIVFDFLHDLILNLYLTGGPNEADRDWFAFMLPVLIERAHEADNCGGYLVEQTINGFIRFYSAPFKEEYPEFLKDVLETLGQALMKKEFWDDEGEIIAARFGWPPTDTEAPTCNGAIASSLFFCLLYLPPNSVEKWTESILAIKSSYFRAHFLLWLVAAKETLSETNIRFESFSKACIDWMDSSLLTSTRPGTANTNPEIPTENAQKFLATIRKGLTKPILEEWFADFSKVRDIAANFDDLPLLKEWTPD
jgi:hypothetical protein